MKKFVEELKNYYFRRVLIYEEKWLALALSMAMVVGSITGCGGSDSNKDASNSSKSNDSAKVETVADGGGKVLNIYVWNTEFKERFEKYYPDYNKDTQSIGDVKVKFVTNTNEGGVYQKKLDAALKNRTAQVQMTKLICSSARWIM